MTEEKLPKWIVCPHHNKAVHRKGQCCHILAVSCISAEMSRMVVIALNAFEQREDNTIPPPTPEPSDEVELLKKSFDKGKETEGVIPLLKEIKQELNSLKIRVGILGSYGRDEC